VGPGAVRFISGTYAPHVELEGHLAAFHGREAAMIFSSAYATVLSVVVPLTTDQTVLISEMSSTTTASSTQCVWRGLWRS